MRPCLSRTRTCLRVRWGNDEGSQCLDAGFGDVPAALQTASRRSGASVRQSPSPARYRDAGALPLALDQYPIAGVIGWRSKCEEHPETAAGRLERTARPAGNRAGAQAGVDCGFDPSAGTGGLPEDVVWPQIAAGRFHPTSWPLKQSFGANPFATGGSRERRLSDRVRPARSSACGTTGRNVIGRMRQHISEQLWAPTGRS